MKYFLLLLVFFIIFIILFCVSVYNMLLEKEENVNKLWFQLKDLIDEQFMLLNDNKKVKNIIRKYQLTNSVDGIMECFLELEKSCDNNLLVNKDKIGEVKDLYNHAVLQYNSIVSGIPTSFIAYICKFKPKVWFRDN